MIEIKHGDVEIQLDELDGRSLIYIKFKTKPRGKYVRSRSIRVKGKTINIDLDKDKNPLGIEII